MKKIVFPFIVLLLLVFVSCEEEEPVTYYVGELERYIPFEGGEQLHYFVNGTEKIILSPSEKSFSMFRWSRVENESLWIDLRDSIGHSVFTIRILAGSGRGGDDSYMTFDHNFYISEGEDSNGGFSFHYSFSGQYFDSQILDSLKVRDKTYYNVIEAHYGDSYNKIYYCESDGIIKSQGIKSTWINDGNDLVHDTIIYELEKIVWN